jgi:hypothetical protein
MPIPWWKQSLAAGLLVAGADRVAADPPAAPGAPILYSPASEGVFVPPAAVPCPAPRPAVRQVVKPMARGSLMHPRDFPAAPFGHSVGAHFQAQVNNGISSRMALHDYDFVAGGDQLTHRGKERVRQIAVWTAANPSAVVVEWLPQTPKLADARRAVVLAELSTLLGPVPAERVVVGPPVTPALQGAEAELIYGNLIRLTDSYGTFPSTGVRGAAGGGAGSQGGGGGAATGSGPGR